MADGKLVKFIKGNVVSTLFIAGTILTSGAIINLIQVLLHVLVKPFNRDLFHKLMYYVCWTWLAQIIFIADYWSNSELILYCKPEDFKLLGKEHNFSLMNHCYEIDWLYGWAVIDRFATLGHSRGFIKNGIKYIPIAGWFFKLAEHIFLERDFEKDKEVIEKQIQYTLEINEPAWPVMTAEGTRFTKEKHDASVQFAKERNLVPLKHHLIPRAKGFVTCVPILKKYKCPSILNIQIAFDKDAEVKPSLGNLLQGKKVVGHMYIERIPMEEVEATSEYLQKIYQIKDELQDSFIKYGNFTEGRNQEPLKPIKMEPRLCVLINSICWNTLNVTMLLYYAINLIAKGKLLLFITVFGGIVALFYLMTLNMLNASSVAKGSQYGKAK
ncbi:unnamed protein product [Diamesa tonsa]